MPNNHKIIKTFTCVILLGMIESCITSEKKLSYDDMLKYSHNSNSILLIEIPHYKDNTKGQLELSINDKRYFGITFPTRVKPGELYSIPVPAGHLKIRYYFMLYGGKIHCDTMEPLTYELQIKTGQTVPLNFIMVGPPSKIEENLGCAGFPLPLYYEYQPVALWKKDVQ